MVKWQKDKKTNNGRHNITQKTKDRSTRISLKSHQSNHIITDGFRLNLMKDNLNETKCLDRKLAIRILTIPDI